MNKVFLIGRLTKDPELRYTEANIPVCRFSLAVNRRFTNQEGEREADFINISVWRKAAENVKNYVKKGSQVAIDGRIQTGSYEKDGTRFYTFEVVADNVQFLDSKTSETVSNEDKPLPNVNEIKVDPFEDFGQSIAIDDDELPF